MKGRKNFWMGAKCLQWPYFHTNNKALYGLKDCLFGLFDNNIMMKCFANNFLPMLLNFSSLLYNLMIVLMRLSKLLEQLAFLVGTAHTFKSLD